MPLDTPPLAERLGRYKKFVKASKPTAAGRLTRVVGLTLEAVGCRAPLGSQCLVETLTESISAEIVGFSDESIFPDAQRIHSWRITRCSCGATNA